MATLVAVVRIACALSAQIPPTTRFSISPGDCVRVYRDWSQSWDGPFDVQRIIGKHAWLLDHSGRIPQFNIVQLLPEPSDMDDRILATKTEFLRRNFPEPFPDPLPRSSVAVNLTETRHPGDPRGASRLCRKAKTEELGA